MVFADSSTAGCILQIVLDKDCPMLYLGYSCKEERRGEFGRFFVFYIHFLVGQTATYKVWWSRLDQIPVWFESYLTKVGESE